MSILPFPQEFDQNEWFIIICILALAFILYKLPKRFPTSITILLLLFTISISRVVDHLIAGPNINFYDIMDTGKFEFFDLFCYISYAPWGYVFVYYYDKFQLKGVRLLVYLICVALVSIGFEWLTTTEYISFFKYSKWKVIYSLPVYLIIQPCTLLFYNWLQHIHQLSLLKTE
jgi:hypothetical protein